MISKNFQTSLNKYDLGKMFSLYEKNGYVKLGKIIFCMGCSGGTSESGF